MIDTNRLVTHTFVRSAEWVEVVDSTNSYVSRSSPQQDHLPWLVGADSQTAGRGRNRNQWWSANGALTFSLALNSRDFGIANEHLPLLSLAVGMTLRETLATEIPEHHPQVKWPNDLYVGHRKIAGILIESHPSHPGIMIIGIGLNVNNSTLKAPAEIKTAATSMTDLLGRELSLTSLLIQLHKELESQLQQLAENSQQLISNYRQHCYLTGKTVCVENGAKVALGSCLGIDDDGSLRIQTENGEQRFLAGSVAVIEN